MKPWIGLWLLITFHFSALAHEGHDHGTPLAISLALDSQNHLLRVSVKDGFVLFDKAQLQQPLVFSKPIKINLQNQKIGTDGDARPKISLANNGNIYVTWTQLLSAPYSGYIWFSRSLDGGKTFSPPIIVHQDRQQITHRFDALSVAPNGRIYIAWVDKRDLIAAKKNKTSYDGAAIYYSVSDDEGESFRSEKKIVDQSCECCRIAIITDEDHDAVMMWRHLFEGGVRDHAIAKINPNQTHHASHRASFANWKIDACPHHGPAIALADSVGYHLVWFDGGDYAGLRYALMDKQFNLLNTTREFGDAGNQAGHPAIVSVGKQVWLAWKEIIHDGSQILFSKSLDGGQSWGQAIKLAQTQDKSDYPQLLHKDGLVYLGWNSQLDGLIWITLPE